MPVFPVWTTFRITFNDEVTVTRVHDFLHSRSAAAQQLQWTGVFCIENSCDDVLHGHGVVFNKDARTVRDALRRFVSRHGGGGNELYSVSAARDNNAALQYCCKDVCEDPWSPDENSMAAVLWFSGIALSGVGEACKRYHERAAELAASRSALRRNGSQTGGTRTGPRTAGQLAVARLVELCRDRSVSTIHEIVEMMCETYVAEERPIPLHYVQSVCWTVFMILNGQTGVQTATAEVVRRMGFS